MPQCKCCSADFHHPAGCRQSGGHAVWLKWGCIPCHTGTVW